MTDNYLNKLDVCFTEINSDKTLCFLSNDKKFAGHNYTKKYYELFEKYKDKPISLLEIGVSLWHCSTATRYDLNEKYIGTKTWKKVYPNIKLHGFDINKYSSDKDIKMYHGDQSCKKCLEKINEEFDIIIDDGSHARNHQQYSFFKLFRKIKKGGCYIIEDCHSDFDSYLDDKLHYDKKYAKYSSICTVCKYEKFNPIKKGISTFELFREWNNGNWIIPDNNNNYMTYEDKINFIDGIKNKIDIDIHLTNRYDPFTGKQYKSGTLKNPINSSIMIIIKKI